MRTGIAQQGTVFFLWLILPFFFSFRLIPGAKHRISLHSYQLCREASSKTFTAPCRPSSKCCFQNLVAKVYSIFYCDLARKMANIQDLSSLEQLGFSNTTLSFCIDNHTGSFWLPTVNSMINRFQSLPASLLRASRNICVHRKYQDKITAAQKTQKQVTIQWEAEEGSLLEQYLSMLLQLD